MILLCEISRIDALNNNLFLFLFYLFFESKFFYFIIKSRSNWNKWSLKNHPDRKKNQQQTKKADELSKIVNGCMDIVIKNKKKIMNGEIFLDVSLEHTGASESTRVLFDKQLY